MKVLIGKDYDEMSHLAGGIVADLVLGKPDACLGLATGSTPLGLYQQLVYRCGKGLDFSRIHTVNLDEYVGLSPEHTQSYRYFMDHNLFNYLNIDKKNTFVVSGVGDQEACLNDFRTALAACPRDIQVLGVGVDGHIGFNEPGEALHVGPHLETLDESTIDANCRFFASRDEVPRTAYTMGMGDILQAKRLLILMNGKAKASAARQLLFGDQVTPHCPVTFAKLHPDCTVLLDQALADEVGWTAN